MRAYNDDIIKKAIEWIKSGNYVWLYENGLDATLKQIEKN